MQLGVQQASFRGSISLTSEPLLFWVFIPNQDMEVSFHLTLISVLGMEEIGRYGLFTYRGAVWPGLLNQFLPPYVS